MIRIGIIAGDEWRYWLRSKLALAALILTAILIVATTGLTATRMSAERDVRFDYQSDAEDAFRSQPSRHPHRMVHYGHYLFRAPAPLATIDPGLDSVTGQSIFLEGHRQNTVTFAEVGASSDLGGFERLTPALVYQLFGPLLLLLLGHGAIARERESGSLGALLAQGVKGIEIVAGKALALLSVALLLVVPVLAGSTVAVAAGETPAAALSLAAAYLLYLFVWIGLIMLASAMLTARSMVLAVLASAWLTLVLIVPTAAVKLASRLIPGVGKIEGDLMALRELREIGDGHNAEDPVFTKLRSEILQRYGVHRIEDLPINFRGVAAEHAEEKLTRVLNAHAESKFATEQRQADILAHLGWISPALSLGRASRAIAGTDLESYHRFQREAEALRYDFVQSLNRVHTERVAYSDDANRSNDAAAEAGTRVGTENWALLDSYRYEAIPLAARLENARTPLSILSAWLLAALLGCVAAGRRIRAW